MPDFKLHLGGLEKLEMPPPYNGDAKKLAEDLKDVLEYERDIADWLHCWKLKHVVEWVKHRCLYLPTYQSPDKKQSLVGSNPYLCVQLNSNASQTVPMPDSESFWKTVEKKYDGLLEAKKKKKVVELTVSLGYPSARDTRVQRPPSPDMFGDDEGEDNDTQQGPNDFDPYNIKSPEKFSQQGLKGYLAPPSYQPPKTHAQVRADSTQEAGNIQEFYWKCYTNPHCELYHAITREHFDFIQKRDLTKPEGMLPNEKFDCEEYDDDTWPTLDFLPDEVKHNPDMFEGKTPQQGEYPPTSGLKGSYPSYKLNAEQKKRLEKEESRKLLLEVAQAISGGKHRGGEVEEAYVVRLENTETKKFVDIDVSKEDLEGDSNNSPITLLDLYDNELVKEAGVRKHRKEVVQAIKNTDKELFLCHRNHQNLDRLHRRYAINSLGDASVKSLIGGLEKNKDGVVVGAAYPVSLCLEATEVIHSEGDMDDL